MVFVPIKISGAFRVVLAPLHDHRGFFYRTYDRDVLTQHGLVTKWVQESHSFSAKKGTVRGLHFQCQPYAETKLVRASQGQIFMVLLDLRAGSSTFGQWDSIVLSSDSPELLYAPKGLAMGMCTLTNDCSLLYKMDIAYHSESTRTIRWDDPFLRISWPLSGAPTISEKDMSAPMLKEYLAREGALVI
jgi:dTDP-4-dehydrorhamnose 3,5-epimerase